MTLPTTTVTTTTTPALPLEALGLQPAVATPRRVEPMEVKKVTRTATTTTPPADAPANRQENVENVGQVDGPAKSSDTTLKVTPSTSGTAGKTPKRQNATVSARGNTTGNPTGGKRNYTPERGTGRIRRSGHTRAVLATPSTRYGSGKSGAVLCRRNCENANKASRCQWGVLLALPRKHL